MSFFRPVATTAALVVLSAAACTARQPLLSDVRVSPATMSPNGEGAGGATQIYYAVSRPAKVSVYLTSASGHEYHLRQDERRAGGTSYQLDFDGTYTPPQSPPDVRRVIPSGKYVVTVEATDGQGRTQIGQAELDVVDADTQPPEVQNVVADPTTISPNFDAIDDVTRITYRLTKEAQVQIYATDQKGNVVYVGGNEKKKSGEYSEVWGAVVNGQPLSDGKYTYVIKAKDKAGNVSVGTVPIVVASGGVPEARILRVEFSPHELMVGDLLKVEITVKNTGNTVIRTQGPDPGYVYSSYDSYASIVNHVYADKAGLWRVGVDWAGAPTSSGSRYPYRWGFGHDLQPGETVTVVGYMRVEQKITRMYFFAGLIQEGIRYHDDGVGQAEIKVSF